ncbi:MAG: glutathione S-transferase family protein [Phormidesmis sp.]
MLKFYYHPLSPIARRVWLALLEKEIPFESVLVDLANKQQFSTEFLALSPFHHVPAVVHREVHLIESIAILDYLDREFPQMPLSPAGSADFAKMRMVQMVVTNELLPKLTAFVGATEDRPLPQATVSHLDNCLQFLNRQIGESAYFGGNSLNLADIVAGATVPLFCRLGLPLLPYPAIAQWHTRITQRSAWQLTRPSDPDFQQWQRWIQLQVTRQQRKLAKKQ